MARELTESQSDQIRAGLADESLAELDLEPHPVRFYPNAGGSPNTTLASQLLGFVTQDGQGRYGIEQASQGILTGQSGATASTAGSTTTATEGGSVQLTIDASLQLQAREGAVCRVGGRPRDPRHRRRHGSVHGRGAGLGSVPGYDANDYAGVAEKIARAVHRPGLQPGLRAGLGDEDVHRRRGARGGGRHAVVARSRRLAPAPGRQHRRELRQEGHGRHPVRGRHRQLAQRRHGHVALALGDTIADAATRLYEMWQRLGIGDFTGVGLQSESAGIVANPANSPWQSIDLVNRSFGQGVAITPLQLARAYSAMINGGLLADAARVRLRRRSAGARARPDAGHLARTVGHAARADDPCRRRRAATTPRRR